MTNWMSTTVRVPYNLQVRQLFPLGLLDWRVHRVQHARELVAVFSRVNAVRRRTKHLGLGHTPLSHVTVTKHLGLGHTSIMKDNKHLHLTATLLGANQLKLFSSINLCLQKLFLFNYNLSFKLKFLV